MPRKKIPQRRIALLRIPEENQNHQQNVRVQINSTLKKYKHLRVARLNCNYDKIQEINLKTKQESADEIEKINNNYLLKNENINNDSKKLKKADQENINDTNSMMQHINININQKFDFLLSTFNGNLEDDFDYNETSDLWSELL